MSDQPKIDTSICSVCGESGCRECKARSTTPTPKIDDGGPAFPNTITCEPDGAGRLWPDNFGYGGMTLLDYFAAAALSGYCANAELLRDKYDDVAMYVFNQAKSMLAERRRRMGGGE
jgi:hypothetical protein